MPSIANGAIVWTTAVESFTSRAVALAPVRDLLDFAPAGVLAPVIAGSSDKVADELLAWVE
jgi:hypothetical protein